MDDQCGILVQKIIERYHAPKVVLESSVGDLIPDPPLSSYFADVNKKFPIHTKAAAWVSSAWYIDNDLHIPEIETILYKTLRKYGMEKEWAKLKNIKKSIDKKESSTIVLPVEGLHIYAIPDKNRFPIYNPRLLCKAAVYLDKHRDEYSLDFKKIYASNCIDNFEKLAGDDWVSLFNHPEVDFNTREYILQKSLKTGSSVEKVAQDITKLLEIYSGRFLPDYENWRTKLFSPRIKLATFQNEYKVLSEISENLNKYFAANDPDTVLKAAEDIRKIDLKHFKYLVNDPVMEVALTTLSQAKDIESKYVKSASGAWYKLDDLHKIPASTWAAKFGCNPLMISDKRIREFLENPVTSPECERFLAYHSIFPASGEAASYRTIQLFT